MVVQESPTPPFAKGGAIPGINMYYIYLLKCNDQKFYIGYSSNLKLRYKQHQEGKVESTKYRRPLQLVYYESYINENLAQKREEKLKMFGSAYTALLKRLNYK